MYKYIVQMAAQQVRIQIDLKSAVPAYRQIVESARVLLVEGRLAPGTRLPSVRRLAMELGVHFNTVSLAYRELADEGWLDLRHGSGAIVIERGAPTAKAGVLGEFRTQLRRLIAQSQASGVSASRIASELRSMSEGLEQ